MEILTILDEYNELLLAYQDYERLLVNQKETAACEGMIIIRLNDEFEQINLKLGKMRSSPSVP